MLIVIKVSKKGRQYLFFFVFVVNYEHISRKYVCLLDIEERLSDFELVFAS